MSHFLIVESNGQISASVTAKDTTEITKESTQRLVKVASDLNTVDYYVDANDVVRLKPEAPSQFHVWNYSATAWIPDVEKARQLFSQRWTQFCERKFQEGFTFQGEHYQADDRLALEVLSAVALNAAFFDIRRKDNLMQRFDSVTLQAFSQVLAAFRQSVFTQVFAGKDAIQTATTLEDILALEPPA